MDSSSVLSIYRAFLSIYANDLFVPVISKRIALSQKENLNLKWSVFNVIGPFRSFSVRKKVVEDFEKVIEVGFHEGVNIRQQNGLGLRVFVNIVPQES